VGWRTSLSPTTRSYGSSALLTLKLAVTLCGQRGEAAGSCCGTKTDVCS
jgi:hypothetical protein